jgi:hypothetical protein
MCESQWVPIFTVDNIATEYLPLKFTLKYEEPLRPGVQLTESSGTFNQGQSRTIKLPSNSVKINFSLEYSPFMSKNTIKSLVV